MKLSHPSRKKIFFKKRSLTQSTIKKAKNYLPNLLSSIERCMRSQSQQILRAWDRLSQEKYSNMSKAVGYDNKTKTLLIKVFNSSFYAMLSQCPQKQLIAYIKQTAPYADIERIHFILG